MELLWGLNELRYAKHLVKWLALIIISATKNGYLLDLDQLHTCEFAWERSAKEEVSLASTTIPGTRCSINARLVAQSCLTLCNLNDCSLPGASVYGILQARILEWVATSSSKRSSQPRIWTCVSYVSCTSRWVPFHWCHLGIPTGTIFVPKSSVMECAPSSTQTPRR